MTVQHASFALDFEARASFADVTDQVIEAISAMAIDSGVLTVYSQHTTCTVIIQEQADDVDYWGEQYILQDMMNGISTVFPTCTTDGQYLHPGPEHIRIAEGERDEKGWWSYNTDAHLRSVVLGRSVTIPIVEGVAQLGEFGRIYFGDLDQLRARTRTVRVAVIS